MTDEENRKSIQSAPPAYTPSAVFSTNGGDAEDEVLEHERELLETGAESDVESVYPMKTIQLDKGFYTIYELKRKYEKEPPQIVLDSSFQRNSVWSLRQKRELIESALMGLPLPIFYFNQDREGRLVVIDGRQRLTAFFDFLNGGFALDRLTILKDLNRKKFGDLDGSQQTKLEDYQIIAHVIQPPTPDRIKFDIFDRVNRAGTKLNKQEIRNALYQGNATELLKRLCAAPEFAAATEGAFAKERRMKDRYLILRFIAFFLCYQELLFSVSDRRRPWQYSGDIDELLGIAMEYLNNCPEEELKRVETVTRQSLAKVCCYVGGNAFRLTELKEDGSLRRYPVNINIFETLMLGMTMLPEQDESLREAVRTAVEELKDNPDFRDSLNNHRDGVEKTERRRKMIVRLMNQLLSGGDGSG